MDETEQCCPACHVDVIVDLTKEWRPFHCPHCDEWVELAWNDDPVMLEDGSLVTEEPDYWLERSSVLRPVKPKETK